MTNFLNKIKIERLCVFEQNCNEILKQFTYSNTVVISSIKVPSIDGFTLSFPRSADIAQKFREEGFQVEVKKVHEKHLGFKNPETLYYVISLPKEF